MHSATSILAQTNMLDSTPKIINSYWENEYVTHVPFIQFLLDKLNGKFSNKTILEYGEQSKKIHTYRELSLFIRKAANLLKDIPANEYVLFICSNSISYLSLYFGSIFNGSIPLNLPNHNYYSLQDIRTFIILHNVKYLVLDGGFNPSWLHKIINSVSSIKKIFLYSFPTTLNNEKIVQIKDCWLDSDEIPAKSMKDLYDPSNLNTVPCLAVNSNGSNQWPPLVYLYNNYSLVATCETIANGKIFELRPIDITLAYGSFEHLENLLMFLSAIMNGCIVIVLPKFDYIQILDAINKYRVNMAILPSNFLIKLLKDCSNQLSLDALVRIIVFGGKLSTLLCQKFFKRFTNVKSIRHCYILAESPLPITIMIRNSRDYGSIGYPFPNTRIKIINLPNKDDDNDDDYEYEMLEANRSGLICINRDRSMFALAYLSYNSLNMLDLNFQNYHQDEDDNGNNCQQLKSQQYGQEQQPKQQQSVWFITKDIGFYDENGLICIHGQFRDPVYDLNVLTQQSRIERALLSHPLISESFIMEMGPKKFTALIALKFMNTYLTPKLYKQIIDWINENNINYRIEKLSLFVKYNLPKNNNGRYIDSLIRKEILNLNNIQEKF